MCVCVCVCVCVRVCVIFEHSIHIWPVLHLYISKHIFHTTTLKETCVCPDSPSPCTLVTCHANLTLPPCPLHCLPPVGYLHRKRSALVGGLIALPDPLVLQQESTVVIPAGCGAVESTLTAFSLGCFWGVHPPPYCPNIPPYQCFRGCCTPHKSHSMYS